MSIAICTAKWSQGLALLTLWTRSLAACNLPHQYFRNRAADCRGVIEWISHGFLRGSMSHLSTSFSGPKRRSQRVLMQVGIRVRGTDSQGKNFEEDSHTLAISAHGALVLLRSRVTSGSIVTLRNARTEEETETHVAYLGPVREGKAEVGLEFTGPRPAFWRIAFPPEDWTPRNPEARGYSRTK